MKDAVDDIVRRRTSLSLSFSSPSSTRFVQRRHRSDQEVNRRETTIVIGHDFVPIQWKDLRVGDIVRLTNDESVSVMSRRSIEIRRGAASTSSLQADLLLISTSEPNGLSFIETMELDGETNLKLRRALEVTCSVNEHSDQFSRLDGSISQGTEGDE